MVHFAESAEAEVMDYLMTHQLYLGVERSGEVLWSFHPVFGGKRYEILGPSVAFSERKAGSEKPRTYFQVPGQKRWHPAGAMAGFAFDHTFGFAWKDMTHEPRCALEILAMGSVGHGDDRLRDRAYYEVRRGTSVAKLDFAIALAICEGYGFAQSGFSYDPIKRK